MYSSRLRAFRKAIKLTQKQMADTLGIAQSTYAYIETGKTNLSIEYLHKIMDIHKINPLWFITGKGKMVLSENEESENESSLGNSVQVFKTPVQVIPQFNDKSYTGAYRRRKCNLLLPTGERAGYLSGWKEEYITEHVRCVSIPGVQGPALTVEVSEADQVAGLAAGDWLSCAAVEEWIGIDQDSICVIISEKGGILIGYASAGATGIAYRPALDDAAPIHQVPAEEIREVWVCRVLITSRLPAGGALASVLVERLHQIEQFLSKQHPNWRDDLAGK